MAPRFDPLARVRTGLWLVCALTAIRLLVMPVAPLAAAEIQAGLDENIALTADDRILYQDALAAGEKGNWKRARALAKRGHNELASKIIDWLYHRQRGGGTFSEISSFVDRNPDWPWRGTLRRNAERALGAGSPYDDDEVRRWMDRWPPLIGEGRAVLGEVLIRAGEEEAGLAMLRNAWATTVLSRKQELHIYRRYHRKFTADDHLRRTETLLWQREIRASRRMVPRLPRKNRALALARIGLQEYAGNVDTLISKIPEEFVGDGGLALDRVRWRRSKGYDERAREILLDPPDDPGIAKYWWKERKLQVRAALRDGEVSDAYRIAAEHGLPSDIPEYSDAEWLSGWVALRFLDDPLPALGHFAHMYAAVRLPVSQARGAYWAGRAAKRAGDNNLAARWYETAARHQLTYYGQLAMQALGGAVRLEVLEGPVPTLAEARAFRENENVRAARMLAELGYAKWTLPFIMKLEEDATGPGQRTLAAILAADIGRIDLAVRVAKQSAYDNVLMVERGYPLVAMPAIAEVDPALLLAIGRQETLFNPVAISSAGAQGILQIMPATAKTVARKSGLPYSKKRLIQDPDYNVLLAGTHLRGLLKRYDGSYVLSIAAYNAGEGRVSRWIRAYGDPRWPDVDPIDWIESLPFDETRNYVQRVLENLQVYRLRLASDAPLLRLAQDLARGS